MSWKDLYEIRRTLEKLCECTKDERLKGGMRTLCGQLEGLIGRAMLLEQDGGL